MDQFVSQCHVCQQNKHETVPYPGLLHPLPILETPWKDIAMDFVEGLPSSNGFTVIWVIIDRLTKYAHLTAADIATVFIDQVYKLHGLPSSIVSDRDRLFLGHFWHSLFKMVGTSLKLSSSYHPQTDGQSERLNQCIECYLRCMTSKRPKKWVQWISLAEWWYNF